jgi:FkbM family methyltransferase
LKLFKKLVLIKDRFLFQNFGIPRVKDDLISKRYLKRFLEKDPVIIDCGAHDGGDSIELAQILGGEIYAFEPVEFLFKRLVKRTQNFSKIHCYQLALSDYNGVQTFYVSEGQSDGSSSLLEPKDHLKVHPGTFFSSKTNVKTMCLDTWASSLGIRKVDMLWLDMQGYELPMLKASKVILPTVKLIHTEVSTKETYKNVSLYPEYRLYLESLGFQVLVEAIPEGWDMGNVVFVRQ